MQEIRYIVCFGVSYQPLSVEVKNTSTGNIEKIELGHELDELFGSEKEQITKEDIDVVNMMLLIKDQYNVSTSAFMLLADKH